MGGPGRQWAPWVRWGRGRVLHNQEALCSWSYGDLEGATTCGVASPGSGLSERKALNFLPVFLFFFFSSQQIQKQLSRGSKGQEGVERSRAPRLGGRKAVPRAG